VSVSENKTPLEQAMDLFVYAPLGFVFNLTEVMPELVAKGRKQVKLARMFGHYAVDKQAPQIISKWQAELARTVGLDRPQARDRDADGRAASSNGSAARTERAERAERAEVVAGEPTPARSGPDAATLAIPDYDSLSASQVVPRLAGLTPAELEAVGAYEGAHRGRRTILNKVAQLQAG
jgi:hypothetical protein